MLVMDAMGGDPEDGTALQRQGTANRQEVFESSGEFVGSVGMQAMVSHADAQSVSDPVKEQRGSQRLPAKHEQSDQGPDMESQHDQGYIPIHLLVGVDFCDLRAH